MTENEEKILVVDDEAVVLDVIKKILSPRGFRVYTATNVVDAIKILETKPFDIVITDLKMPKVSGFDLMRHIRSNYRDIEVMVITGYPSIEGAVQAVKIGAEEYLTKPFTGDELISSVNRLAERLRARRGDRTEEGLPSYESYGMTGSSENMRVLYGDIVKAAMAIEPVLIMGEHGAGKELVARVIHYSSSQAPAPFISVNCSTIVEKLAEGTLASYVSCALARAAEIKDEASAPLTPPSTLFFRNISNLTAPVQAILVRLLKEKKIITESNEKIVRPPFRIIASSTRDILGMVKKKLFREDLYFRMNFMTINVPPLRERQGDVELLAEHFAAIYSKLIHRQIPRFSQNALDILKSHDWPGNVRDLEQFVEFIVGKNDKAVIDVPELVAYKHTFSMEKVNLRMSLDEVTAQYIHKVLMSVKGNKTKAAEILGVDRKTLRKKLVEHNLEQ
ncbi:MAG: sigma-54 dependent transcriptional regulator [Candidatus Eremiobacteraeota bacterium]|nr:sigma-54 dependent transcriptional regulator [Candidatus Eremiobacteraeota bacterium]